MCGRFYLPEEDSMQALNDLLARLNRSDVKRGGEINPGDTIPVIANSREMEARPFGMKWGYSLPGKSGLIFNARSETAAASPLFRDGMAVRRCLIPAQHYFEWEKRGREKIRYAIRPEEEGLFYLAGIYRFEGNTPVCAVLTRPPCEPIRFIHDRMPVMLPLSLQSAWLDVKTPPRDLLNEAIEKVMYTPA